MSNPTNDSRPPVAAPVLFALLGLAALVAAVLLMGADQGVPAVPRATECPECPSPVATPAPATADAPAAPAAAPTEQPSASTETAEQAPTPAAPTAPASPAPTAPAPPDPPTPPASGSGPWTIALDPGSYEPDAAGQQAIAAIAAFLAANPDARAKLIGVNDFKKSSKRAKQAARKVRELITTGDVAAGRIATEFVQEPGAEGLMVRAAIVGGAR